MPNLTVLFTIGNAKILENVLGLILKIVAYVFGCIDVKKNRPNLSCLAV